MTTFMKGLYLRFCVADPSAIIFNDFISHFEASLLISMANPAGEQRAKLMPILHSLYVKPLSTRRLLHWHCQADH
jgi:hypothetical protein